MQSKDGSNSHLTSKLKKVELSDGWTFISGSKGRRSNRNRAVRQQLKSTTTQGSREVDNVKVKQIIQQIRKAIDRFNALECARMLYPTIQSKYAVSPDIALCAGLGNMDPEVEGIDSKRAISQFAVFHWIVKNLSSLDTKTKLISCDPRFTATDIAVLEHFDVQVLPADETPGLMTQQSFLYAPFLPWPVLTLDFLAKTTSSLLICQDLENILENLQLRLGAMLGDDAAEISIDGRNCTHDDVKKAVEVIEAFLDKKDGTVDSVLLRTTEIPACELHLGAFRDLKVYDRRRTDE